MTVETMLLVVVALLGSTVIAAWIGFLTAKKRLPMETTTAEATAAQVLVGTSVVLTKSMEERLDKLEGKVVDLEAHSNVQDGEISMLRKHLDSWLTWAQSLRNGWSVVRQNIEPPDLPYMHGQENDRLY